ncbi:hypothetical protein qu_214 [Acanthamoeba polyphaga mimivirus]|nr:hypothetical protein [Mimivirus reunion]WMV61552.1 hypothetical protein qu_214 [Mimivirus sp.]WMV62529.1 hypothetical protein qu_214 [Acanthamoeba polyphaga mimivirus]WMV63506.1 hypothetical protein qu_214 [Mimivirus sp.]
MDSHIHNDTDDWFNDLDQKSIQVISNKLIPEESNSSDEEISLENINSRSNFIDDNDKIEHIFIEDILKKDVVNLSSNELLQYQCSVAYFIQVLFEGLNDSNELIANKSNFNIKTTSDKMNSMVEYLEWISGVSEILAKRIGQQIYQFIPDRNNTITRSSYNFCPASTQCKKFYSKNENPTCKSHHFVHSLLKYDVDSVIYYLKHNNKNGSFNTDELNNLHLSIKTICFVTRHMAREISYIENITKNNSEQFHRNNPADLTKKKSTNASGKKSWDSVSTIRTHKATKTFPQNKTRQCSNTKTTTKSTITPINNGFKESPNQILKIKNGVNRYSILSEY